MVPLKSFSSACGGKKEGEVHLRSHLVSSHLLKTNMSSQVDVYCHFSHAECTVENFTISIYLPSLGEKYWILFGFHFIYYNWQINSNYALKFSV